jgi:hypothetical protein
MICSGSAISLLVVSSKTVTKDPLIERSPSRKISAKRLGPAETSCAEGEGHAIAVRPDIGASSDIF